MFHFLKEAIASFASSWIRPWSAKSVCTALSIYTDLFTLIFYHFQLGVAYKSVAYKSKSASNVVRNHFWL